MNKITKCEYCKKPLSMDNTVLIRIDRFDKYGFHYKQHMYCTNCWDLVKILIDERCEDCKHSLDNPGTSPCRTCGHCYMSHFEEDKQA